MKTKKLQVFVSSTYADLKIERQAAVMAILSTGNIPAGMELFTAGNESQMTVIERWIDESDVYLLILGGRYGSIDEKSGKSYTHLEYEYAIKNKKPFFAVVISEVGLDLKVEKEGRAVLEKENSKKLNEFRAQVLSRLVKFWDDVKDIKIAIHETLADFSYDEKLIGWVRPDKTSNTSALLDEISRLTQENARIRKENTENGSSNISHSQLKRLLEKTDIIFQNEKLNLFNFLKLEGKNLSGYGKYFDANVDQHSIHPYTELSALKIIDDVGGANDYRFKFTDQGHQFYLKTLITSLSEEE